MTAQVNHAQRGSGVARRYLLRHGTVGFGGSKALTA
jgi:hypothetical protein